MTQGRYFVAVVLTASLLLAVTAAALLRASAVAEVLRERQRREAMIAETARVAWGFETVVASERSYLLTGKAEFLKAYQAEAGALEQRRAELSDAYADDAWHAPTVAQLKGPMDRYLAELAAAAAKKADGTWSLTTDGADLDLPTLVVVRGVLDDLRAHDEAQLQAQPPAAWVTTQLTTICGLFLLALALAVVAAKLRPARPLPPEDAIPTADLAPVGGMAPAPGAAPERVSAGAAAAGAAPDRVSAAAASAGAAAAGAAQDRVSAAAAATSASSPPPPAGSPVIDAAEFAKVQTLALGTNRELLERLVKAYIADSAARLERLESAVGVIDRRRIVYEAHGLAGSSATLGARRVAELCNRLEVNADADAELPPLVAALRAELGLATAALSDRLSEFQRQG